MLFAPLYASLIDRRGSVNRTCIQSEHVEFHHAIDILTRRITTDEIAERLGVSHAAIRQARLRNPDTEAYRAPPPNWEQGVAQLAREKGVELHELADRLTGSG